MSNQSGLLSKTLVIGIIFLFICMGITPSVAVDTVKKSSMPISDKTGASDDYKEIITIINADVWEVKGKGRAFIWRDIEIIARSGQPFEIWGIKQPNGNGLFFREKIEYLKAPLFIGLIFSQPPKFASANGIAFGNIEWS